MELNLDDILNNCLRYLKEGTSSKSQFHFPVLGTVNINEVELRTIVLRDFDQKNNSLVFYTDYRSPKIEQIQNNDQVSFLFYDAEKAEQIRIKAKAVIHHQTDLSKNYWDKIRVQNRKDYASKKAPSSLSLEPSNYLEKNWGQHTEDFYQNFAVIINKIMEIDWLVLEKDINKRARFWRKESGFKSEWLIP
ncbi:pyridoxamine 5'-phosphate oxidase family protein [Pedobacter sp. SD-b]|uniref:Pyridoxamine 5'-phosphate oxidase family protein n=1 Tax=Pedobacter segetis TaxID=2793069 RepID=A0ABS1BIX7_9SPHI|nr:pyridoxamine 5'-phosphate oxidase family protein [Pedobacter segetis]MBK0382793.1 pyridoxamine 5'-phosphate oxidase family protein [Pedobacter segetis]